MKMLYVLAVLMLLAAMLVFLPRKSVHAERVVRTDPATVWSLITDTDSYGEWNPIFVEVSGRFDAGETVKISMRTSDGGIAPVEASVEEVVPERLLRQQAGIPGILMAYHRWELEPHPKGTLVTQHEDYRGAAVLVWSPAYVQVLYEEGLEAISKRIE